MNEPEKSKPLPAEDEATPLLAVRCVRALLERHGLPRYRQSAWLAEATGLSYSQAHRRMTGASAWTLEDLERVGSIFGESLAQVVAMGDGEAVHGAMSLGGSSLPCQLWLGPEVEGARPDELVATRIEGRWVAVQAREAGPGPVYRVERLDVRPSDAGRRVIAVLDDDHDLTQSICTHLESEGYDARPFFRVTDLRSSLRGTRYDGYVIDWLIGESSAEKVIGAVREQDPAAPIVMLTAQVWTGVVDEADIAEAVRRYDLVFSEKPVRMPILSATLARAFAPAPPAQTPSPA